MKLAIVDIETTDLKADKGFILCGGVKPLEGPGKIIGLHTEGVGGNRYTIDRKVVLSLRREMERYDGWITWNGLLFDLPFIDDRLMIIGERPLEKRFARGLDMMYHAKMGKSTFTSARLDWVARALKCPIRKTDLDLVVWKEAEAEAIRRFNQGRVAYNYIVDHCGVDLSLTEWVYYRLMPRIQNISKR